MARRARSETQGPRTVDPATSTVRLRPSRPSDLETLVRHRRAMWEEIGRARPEELDRHDDVYRRWVRRLSKVRRFRAYLAVLPSGDVAGSGAVWFRDAQPRAADPSSTEPYILSMYTVPSQRGRGIASRLVDRMIADCRQRGYRRVVLHASVQGRPVYRSLGFERTWEMRLFLDPELARRHARGRRGDSSSRRSSSRGSRARSGRR